MAECLACAGWPSRSSADRFEPGAELIDHYKDQSDASIQRHSRTATVVTSSPSAVRKKSFIIPEILDRFVEECGGKNARISIIPTASELEDTGRNYEKLFRKLGIKHARVLQMLTREDCFADEFLSYIEKSDGVFMTGGNQLRLSTTLGGTRRLPS